MTDRVRVEPLGADRFEELERLFAGRRVVDGCWCMFWRQTGRENDRNWGTANRDAFRARVTAGEPAPGVIASLDDEPVGWAAIAPVPEFGRILRSPTLRPPGGTYGDVWSLNCLYVSPAARGHGVVRALLEGAVEHARSCGAKAVQAYPVDTQDAQVHPDELFTGATSTFSAAGFVEVARRSDRRPIVQLDL